MYGYLHPPETRRRMMLITVPLFPSNFMSIGTSVPEISAGGIQRDEQTFGPTKNRI